MQSLHGRGSFSRATWVLLIVEGLLLLAFLGGLWWLYRVLPEEGVKLHGNVNTGVDLLGTRRDLLWLLVFGTVVTVGNTALGAVFVRWERTASVFLVSVTIPVLLLLLGTLVFLARLNKVP